MDRAAFYAAVRRRASGVFGTSLSQGQVDGCETILDEASRRRTGTNDLAYILATAYHETAHTMQPIHELGGRTYFDKYERGTKIGKALGNTLKGDGYRFRGRGYVQLTGRRNYALASKKLHIDLLLDPDLALQPTIAVAILFEGMAEGWFTGRDLSDFIDEFDETDEEDLREFVEARRIVNGTDKAKLIAGYAASFEHALREAGYAPSKPVGVDPRPGADPQPPAPVPAPVGKDHAIAAAIGAAVSAIAIAAATYAGDVWHSIIGALS